MTKQEASELISSIPNGLSVEEFLVAFATAAAERERKRILENLQPIGYVYKSKSYYNSRIGAKHEYSAQALPVYVGVPE